MATFKQKEEEDQTMSVLPLDAKASLMGLVTNQVGKAWDATLATMWEIQENLLESSTRSRKKTCLEIDDMAMEQD